MARLRGAAPLLGVLMALSCIMIDGLFGFPLRLPCSAVLFWGLLAIGARMAVEESRGAIEAEA